MNMYLQSVSERTHQQQQTTIQHQSHIQHPHHQHQVQPQHTQPIQIYIKEMI